MNKNDEKVKQSIYPIIHTTDLISIPFPRNPSVTRMAIKLLTVNINPYKKLIIKEETSLETIFNIVYPIPQRKEQRNAKIIYD